MDYNKIERLSDEAISFLRNRYDELDDPEAIKEIIKFYLPQLNEIRKTWDMTEVTTNDIKVITNDSDSDRICFNHSPNVLSCCISLPNITFYLAEQYLNCGILVSTGTSITYPKRGFGTFIHAIKEDIARYAKYSYLMYTDSTYEDKPNTKILERIGAKKVWQGYNTRSGNNIAVWMKDLNKYYTTRDKSFERGLNYYETKSKVTEIKETI